MDAKSLGNNAAVTFFDSSGLLLRATATANSNPNLTGFRINSVATPVNLPTGASLKMTLVAKTGLISGSFIVSDTTPGVKPLTVLYSGMVIPDAGTLSPTDGVGVGSFVIKGAAATDASKSGRVTIVTLP
jgi:hypothetical protein